MCIRDRHEELQPFGPIELAEAIIEAILDGGAAECAAEGLVGPGDPGAEDVVTGGAADDGDAGELVQSAVEDGGGVDELGLAIAGEGGEEAEVFPVGDAAQAAMDGKRESVVVGGGGGGAVSDGGDGIAAPGEVAAEIDGVGLHAAEGGRKLGEDQQDAR